MLEHEEDIFCSSRWQSCRRLPTAVKFDLADIHTSPTPFWFAQANAGGRLPDDRRHQPGCDRAPVFRPCLRGHRGVDAIGGGPSWLKSDIFDVVAKVPEGTTRETANLMLQALLGRSRSGLVTGQVDTTLTHAMCSPLARVARN